MSRNKQTRFLFTGGHMTPAFAVIDELERRGYSDFHWVGHEYAQSTTKNKSAEYKITTQRGIPFYNLPAGKFMWVITRHNFTTVMRDMLRFPLGFVRARRLLREIKPDIVISFGGYIAYPIVHQAKKLGLPAVTHEQTVVQGRSNKAIAKLVDQVMVSWESSLDEFPPEKTIFTGNPLRKDIFEVKSDNYHFPDNDLPILFIAGGNQGSYNMSRRIFSVLPQLLEHFNIIHQTGDSTDRETIEKALWLKHNLPSELRARYIAKPFIYNDEIGEVMHKTDIAFCRSGANFTLEFAALGIMSVLMPINWASGGEQRRNADTLAKTGLAVVCKQTDVPNEPERVLKILCDAKKFYSKNEGFNGKPLDECRAEAKKLVKLDAAERIVDEVEKLLDAGT